MKNYYGFSLIELLITLAIISILICIAYPSYTQHLTSLRRNNAAVVLLNLAGTMEQYYTKNNTYAGATLSSLGIDYSNCKNYYTIYILSASNSTYTLEAKPLGTQIKEDTLCGTMTLDQDGNKNISGSGTISECW